MIKVFFRGYGEWRIYEDEFEYWTIFESYEASGVFCLTQKDEDYYIRTNSFKFVKMLYPSSCEKSEFWRLANQGGFENELVHYSDNQYFKKERRGEFDNDPEDTLNLFNDGRKKELTELEKRAVFIINTKRENEILLEDSSDSGNISTTLSRIESLPGEDLKLVAQKVSPDTKILSELSNKNNRRSEQKKLLMSLVDELGFDRQKIPLGGKKQVEVKCCENLKIFSSESVFNKVWSELSKNNEISIENKERFLS